MHSLLISAYLDIKFANSSEGSKGKGKRRRDESGWDQGPQQGASPQGLKRRNVDSSFRSRGPPNRNDGWGPQQQNWNDGQNWGNNQWDNNGNWNNNDGNWDENDWNNQGDAWNTNNGTWENNNQGNSWNQAPFCEVVYLGYDQR